MGDIALAWFQQHPIRVDLGKVAHAQKKVGEEARRLEELLLRWKTVMPVIRKRKAGDVVEEAEMPWARRAKSGQLAGQFKLSHKVLRYVLEGYALRKGIDLERTSTGEATLERDFWSEHIPRLTPKLETVSGCVVHPESRYTEDTRTEARLSVWMAYTRLRMMESRYLFPLAAAERHYPQYRSLGARTTRTSASKFPIQQVPKRRDSLRGVFIPEDRYVFIEADYKAAELSSLAQSYHNLFGGSRLEEAINAGADPHIAVARRIWSDFDEKDEDEQAELRQAAKAVSFGLPGGMGPAKFAAFARGYGLRLTVEEARLLRAKALAADPELSRWLLEQHSTQAKIELAAQNIGIPTSKLIDCLRAWKKKDEGQIHWFAAMKRLRKWERDPVASEYEIPTRPNFNPKYDLWKSTSRSATGGMRGNCFFTEAHNFPFQGAIADIGKVALFNLWSVWNEECVWRPCAFVHDSILIQVLNSCDDRNYVAWVLEDCMTRAIWECLPDIQGGVDVGEPSEAWGKLGGVFA
jgi:hypothetical protein